MKIPSVRFRFFLGRRVTLLLNYFHAKFQGILMSGSLENSSFPCFKCACVVLFGFHGKDEKHAKGVGECFFVARKEKKKSPETRNLVI